VDVYDDIATTRWTAEQAAEAAGVTANAVRNWVYRGHLKHASDDHGRPLLDNHGHVTFWALDVARAEKATRKRARRFVMRAV
jgi:hypothetical protein